jgi:hypothetical protein
MRCCCTIVGLARSDSLVVDVPLFCFSLLLMPVRPSILVRFDFESNRNKNWGCVLGFFGVFREFVMGLDLVARGPGSR